MLCRKDRQYNHIQGHDMQPGHLDPRQEVSRLEVL